MKLETSPKAFAQHNLKRSLYRLAIPTKSILYTDWSRYLPSVTNLNSSSFFDRQESSSILAVVQVVVPDKLVCVMPPLSSHFCNSCGSPEVNL